MIRLARFGLLLRADHTTGHHTRSHRSHRFGRVSAAPPRRPMLLARALTKETLQIRHRARLETQAARLGLSVGAARQRADEPARRRAPRRIGHIRTACVRTGDGLPGPIEFRQIHFALGT